MRRTLEDVYRTRVFEEYGSIENCALATECERGSLHVHPDFGIVEIVQPDGTPAEPGRTGEIVATGFANTNQLFIRCRTGDLAAWDADPCPCGRDHLPVIRELVGRLEDTVVGPDGREMVRFHGLYVGIDGIVEGQLVQHATDRYTINLVPSAGYAPADGEEVSRRLRARLGEGISVEIRLLSEIPRAPNGKFRAVVSHVERTPENRPTPPAQQARS
jgi:phenylacetate-CoA ligase